MIGAGRWVVYAFYVGAVVMGSPFKSLAKSGKEAAGMNNNSRVMPANRADVSNEKEFAWSAEKKLTWSDFRGPADIQDDQSAAATHCGINILSRSGGDNSKKLVVTNTFYASKSWVKPNGRIESVLIHEQGHFDLCEVYTRKLRNQLEQVDINAPHARETITGIYNTIIAEYELRQQAYETETLHGTNLPGQQSWTASISGELK